MDDTSFNPQMTPERSDAVSPEPYEPRMPAIALMGEFSAGKTTLINFLLGEDLLPTRVTATQLPPVWMSYGERSAHYIDSDGKQHELDFDNLHSVPVEGVQYIKIHCEADILRETDLIDTPGISDPNIPDHYRAAVVDYADAVIWCTHATQAWRESERSVWATIPQPLQANSILLATRADKLSERDHGRVQHRLQRETGEDFRNIIMFSATDAIRACQTEDQTGLLAASGGEALLATLQAITTEIAQVVGADKLPLKASVDAGASNSPEANEQVYIRPTRVTPNRSSRSGRPDSTRAALTNHNTPDPADTMDNLADAGAPVTESDDMDSVVDSDGAATHDAGFDDTTETALDETFEVASQDTGAEAVMESPTENPMTGVLDLKQYEIVKPKDPADMVEANDLGNTSDISDIVARADDDADDMAEDESNEMFVSGVDDDETGTAGPDSAKAIWDEVLAENRVKSVRDVVAALGQFMEMLDRRGLVIANPAHGVDMSDEDGDTSVWRMHG